MKREGKKNVKIDYLIQLEVENYHLSDDINLLYVGTSGVLIVNSKDKESY